jgi:hypothetical protein
MPNLNWDNFLCREDGVYQPKRKDQWYVEFAGPEGIQKAALKSTGLPGGSFNNIEVDFINLKYNFPGKWTWDTVEMTLRDFVGQNTTALIYNWWRSSVFNPQTGKQAYGNILKTDITIILLSPAGEEIEKWTLVAAYPEAVKYGDVDYSDDGERELNVTWRYDRAEHASLDKANGVNIDILTDGESLEDSGV